ncbi:chromate efflux transporter [Thetidibacter halocola]|uniref:Chromate efflux transporter n=1 Tax=Thetidibacter halocola TaxID=2827239 RepID=A0A8J7WEW3_9RHOB|nr:chromate efflux transporter [Thetidibacter halocola]MBS0124446.1 chromate efflux transporter [Thetidibacter halocola]
MTDLATLTRVFGRIGLLSFGGPAAQIALMHRVLVGERGWLTETQFLRALSFCMLLPGPEAMQLATWAGWRMRGLAGGLIAGTLFVLPGAVLITALALAYVEWGTRPEAGALMLGVKAAVIAIVIEAVIRVSRKALKGPRDRLIAVLAFAGLFAFALPFPLVIALAALWGALSARGAAPATVPPPEASRMPRLTVPVLAGLWLAPLPILWAMGQTFLFDIAAFFAKLAVVTFGGAYAVLAWMAQEVVQARGWLDAGQMVDALGLAETTPGPLILVTQFVGMLAGHAQGGAALALAAGALTLWMTFLPCFLWIFAFAPHLDRLLARPRLQAALAGVTAAVVGVIANLSLWFAIHVVFAETRLVEAGPLALTLPLPGSLQPLSLPLIAVAVLLLLVFKRGIPVTLAACAALGLALGAL